MAYRLALGILEKAASRHDHCSHDIFGGLGDVDRGLTGYHRLCLLQRAPSPETLIKAADGGKVFLEHALASWTAKRTVENFDRSALDAYQEAYCNDERIRSSAMVTEPERTWIEHTMRRMLEMATKLTCRYQRFGAKRPVCQSHEIRSVKRLEAVRRGRHWRGS